MFPFFILPCTSYYLIVVASSLLLQRLPLNMPFCSIFQNKHNTTMKKGQHTLYNLKLLYFSHLLIEQMHIKHIKIPQPFPIRITHKCKYISTILSSLNPTSHTFSRQSSIPTTNYQSIKCHRSFPKPPLFFLLHKATQGPHQITPNHSLT